MKLVLFERHRQMVAPPRQEPRRGRPGLRLALLVGLLATLALSACSDSKLTAVESPAGAGSGKDSLSRGLLLALSQFEVTPDGEVIPRPKAALLEILVKRAGVWEVIALEDPDSNVFHKAMVYDPGTRGAGILTLGGTAAMVKLWRRGADGFVAETLWERDFGGAFSRMRDAEAAEIFADGRNALAVSTHDQGVVAIVAPDVGAVWEVTEVDSQKDTFVHEIEIGDLNADGVLEVYATPSEPNLFDGAPQPGKVVRYVPAREEGRTVVADLGSRHAKEILVADIDGDGRDELYVSVEAVQGGQLEIRRYDADTEPGAGRLIATLPDSLCRCLSAGDLDGDGEAEMVAAAFKSGLWLLRRGEDPRRSWAVSSIDRHSSGFEHAALVADLDGDGVDELYVASDDQGEVRRYVWAAGRFDKEVIRKREVPESVFTWNLMPVPVELVR